MASRGGQPGNDNGSKGRPWSEAIHRACLIVDPKKKRRKMDLLADKLIAAAMEGDVSALKELGDRIEGKCKQQIELSGDVDNPVRVIEMRIVDPHSADPEEA